jgi:hypothetical protein
MAAAIQTGVTVQLNNLCRLFASFIVLLLATSLAAAQTSDSDTSAAELKLLRSTNQRLAKENDALKAEVAALKKKLSEGEATTRPAALSAGGGGKIIASNRVVFILDGAGSMLNVFDRAKDDLRERISELKPDQLFAVVFDTDGPNPFPNLLLAASEQNKAKVLTIMAPLRCRGAGKLAAVIKAALAMNPNEIFWISDGSDSNDTPDLAEIQKINVKKVKINTNTKLVRTDEQAPRARWMLWTLAAQSGGVCLDEKGEPITEAPPTPPDPPQPQPQNVRIKVNVK